MGNCACNTVDNPHGQLFGEHSDDPSALVARIKCILKFYDEWMVDKDKEQVDLYSIINDGLIFEPQTQYNLNTFLSDYHFVVDEKNSKLITAEIHKMDDEIKDKENDTVCDAEVCRVIDRSEMDRTKARHTYFYDETDDTTAINRNISIQQILDSLHVFMYHTFRIHPDEYQQIEDETTDKEGDDEDDEKQDDLGTLYDDKTTQKILTIIQKAKSASKRFRRARNAAQIHNKFMTANQFENAPGDDTVPQQDGNEQLLLQKQQQKVSNESCDMDALFEELRKKCAVDDTGRSVLKQLQGFVDVEEYDTDAVTDDLDFQEEAQSNLKRILLDRFEIAALIVQQIEFDEFTKHNVYDPGVRFFYWPYFQDNEEERSLIYKSNTVYVYDKNRGYKLKDWYVSKKYVNLKEELTQNDTYPFPMDAYDNIIETATLKLNAYQSAKRVKQLVCIATHWRKPYGMRKGEAIHLHHIVALLSYTNFSNFCYEFSKSFRYISATESEESLKHRHREFCICARYLRECVECFGDEMKTSDITFFYHGISRSMLLDSAAIKLHGTVSTTSEYQVAVSRFAQNGIVLQIKKGNNNNYMPYWSCAYWSAYSEEYEYLFIGGMVPFRISTIRDIPNSQRYDPLMRAMNIFQSMVEGFALTNMKVKKRDVRVLDSLIKEEQNHTLLKSSHSEIPIYFLTLFHYFLNKLDYVDINLNIMDKEYCEKDGENTYYGCKLLSPTFCLDNNPKALNYALLCSLMPNVKSVTVWNYWSGIKESVELNKAFVSSIIEAIVLDTRCKAFHIIVPSIPDSQSLQDWINENQNLFNKYGWTLAQDKTYENPRRPKAFGRHDALSIKKL